VPPGARQGPDLVLKLEHLLLVPAKLGTATAHAALDFYTPSWNGRLLAYGVSLGGSEESVLHLLDVAGKRSFKESIDRTSLSVVAWLPDDGAFFYLRYNPRTPGMKASETHYNARTYLHTLGANPNGDEDPAVFGPWQPTSRCPRARGPSS
jgi:prolyl oligopeptidase